MKRRIFTNQLLRGGLALGTMPFLSSCLSSNENKALMNTENNHKKNKIIKPKRLQVGDTVALLTPSSSLPAHRLQDAIKNIEKLGLKPKLMPNVNAKRGFLAGSEAARLADLHTAFADNTCAGVWCVRGGYGAARLLPKIDFDIIQKNPKVFVGYSDITALHCAIFEQTGLVTFHGPVGASVFTPYTTASVQKTIFAPTPEYVVEHCAENLQKTTNLFQPKVISEGKAKGRLIGGNLSLISAAAGTPYFPDLKGKILFLEDIDERPYRVDRMLVQLAQSADLRQVAGIALGIFEGCNPKPEEDSLSLMECFQDILGGLGVPVMYGLSFGHIDNQFTLPVGIEAQLDTKTQTLTYLESAVI